MSLNCLLGIIIYVPIIYVGSGHADIQCVSIHVGVHLTPWHHCLVSIADHRNQEVEHDYKNNVLVHEPNDPDHPKLKSA